MYEQVDQREKENPLLLISPFELRIQNKHSQYFATTCKYQNFSWKLLNKMRFWNFLKLSQVLYSSNMYMSWATKNDHLWVGEIKLNAKAFGQFKINAKKLSLCHKFNFCKTYIFAILWCKPLIFQTHIIWSNSIHSLKY